MSYTKILAKSDLLKNRCDDNLKTVKKFIDDLPPQGLEKKDKELLAAVTRSRNYKALSLSNVGIFFL